MSTLPSRASYTLHLVGQKHMIKAGKKEYFSKTCRAEFADKQCKIDISKYSSKAFVKNIISKNILCIELIDVGVLLDRKKLLDCIVNQRYRVVQQDIDCITLSPGIDRGVITIGSIINISKACNKTFQQCIDYGNAKNFVGEPFIKL